MDDFFQGNVGVRDSSAGKLMYNLQFRYQVRTQAITVGTSAVALPTATLTRRRHLLIQNNSNNNLYIGGSDVTTANGILLRPQAEIGISVADDVVVYGVADAAGSNVRIMEGA